MRKKRKKVREYLEKILSSDTSNKSDKSYDESFCLESSKMNPSDTNLRTKESKIENKLLNQEKFKQSVNLESLEDFPILEKVQIKSDCLKKVKIKVENICEAVMDGELK